MYYLVGRIIGTHGIKGELKVINESNFDRFYKGSELYIQKENRYEKITINSARVHKGMVLITFNNHFDINEVLEYVNLNIYTDKHEELEEGHYYFDDLIGCEVFNIDNTEIGIVKDILENPTQDLLEVDTGKKITLIPFVEAFIKHVDINKKEIIIEAIEGLL